MFLLFPITSFAYFFPSSLSGFRCCSNTGRAAGASHRKAAVGAGQRLWWGVLRVSGLGPSARHYTLRPRILPAMHRTGHQHFGTGICASGICKLAVILHKTNTYSVSFKFIFLSLLMLHMLAQEVAHCPLCRGEIKTSELVEFPQEEMEEENITKPERWRTSSKVLTLSRRK